MGNSPYSALHGVVRQNVDEKTKFT